MGKAIAVLAKTIFGRKNLTTMKSMELNDGGTAESNDKYENDKQQPYGNDITSKKRASGDKYIFIKDNHDETATPGEQQNLLTKTTSRRDYQSFSSSNTNNSTKTPNSQDSSNLLQDR